MIRPDLHTDHTVAADRERDIRDVPQAAHAQLDHPASGPPPPRPGAPPPHPPPPEGRGWGPNPRSHARAAYRLAIAHARSFIPSSLTPASLRCEIARIFVSFVSSRSSRTS